jgi:hypothetical protein
MFARKKNSYERLNGSGWGHDARVALYNLFSLFGGSYPNYSWHKKAELLGIEVEYNFQLTEADKKSLTAGCEKRATKR